MLHHRFTLIPFLLILSIAALPFEGLSKVISQDLAALPLEELMKIEVRTVEGASRYSQNVEDAPARVDVYTAEEIRAFGFRTLAELLNSIGGVFVTSNRNYSYVGSRGFVRPGDQNTRLLVLIDGNRLGEPVYGANPSGFEMPLDIDLIEKVEVIRGPASSLYGNNAFFGVVNIHTRKGDALEKNELAGFIGENGTGGFRATLSQKNSHEGELVFSHSRRGTAGRDTLYFPELDDPATNFGVATNRDWGYYQNTFLRYAQGPWTFEAIHGSAYKGLPAAPYGTIFNDPDNTTRDTTHHLALNFRQEDRRGGLWDARLIAGGGHSAGRYIFNYAAPGDPVERVTNYDDGDGRRVQLEVAYSRKFQERHHVVAGFDLSKTSLRKLSNWDRYGVYGDQNFPAQSAAFFLEDEWKLRKNLAFNVGMRWDDMREEGFYQSPRLALVWKPTSKTVVKLLHGTAFRLPNVYEKFGVGLKPNPDLQAERTTTDEVILEKQFARGWRGTISAHQFHLLNLLDQRTDPADGLLYFGNNPEVLGRAIELGLERRWDTGKLLRWNYSWHRTWDRATGIRLSDSATRLGKFLASIPVFGRKTRAGMEVVYCGSRKTIWGEDVPPYLSTNLTITQAFPKRGVDLALSMYNLFDTDMYDPSSTEHAMHRIKLDGAGFRLKAVFSF